MASVLRQQTNLARIHVRHLVTVCKHSRIDITQSTFLQLHDTLPDTIEAAEDGTRLKGCYFLELLHKAKQYRLNPPQQGDIRAATSYVFEEWPRFSEAIKAQIREEISSLLN